MLKTFFVCAIVASVPTMAAAQPSPAPAVHHAMHLIKLPSGDYTVPMAELEASGTNGNVTLHPVGLRTLVTVSVSGKRKFKHAFTLHPGSDCTVFGGPRSIALTPAMTGQPSKTLVAIPITNLKASDYVVAVQNATERQQAQEACARL